MTKVYILFYESVLPTFTRLNILLRREDPNIFLIADVIQAFLKKLFSKFVILEAIRVRDDVTKVDFKIPQITLVTMQ